jgi:enoyl-CoA hydratase/carnithine racemase
MTPTGPRERTPEQLHERAPEQAATRAPVQAPDEAPDEAPASGPGLPTRRSGPVATVTISNPAKRNAMTPAMWRELPALLDRLAADPAVRVLVLTGADGTFCSGADISGLTAAAGGPEAARRAASAAEEALAAFPKPALAAVRGHCVGGGCQLAAACDLRFASADARFAVTPARLGIVYPAGATRRLARLVGPGSAAYLLFSGESFDAERALRAGLVDEVLPDAAALEARVAEFAALLASRSLLTQAGAKHHLREDSAVPGEPFPFESEASDAAEGVAAFLERRPARFRWTPPPA